MSYKHDNILKILNQVQEFFLFFIFLFTIYPMFKKGEIWAYPTNTSFGLGARIDDTESLQKIVELKQRPSGKFFSLMVKDFEMLRKYAEIPSDFPNNFFSEKPRTAIFKPTKKLPQSPFWPTEKVAFRVSQIKEISQKIEIPITTTSANISGETPIYSPEKIEQKFSSKVKIFSKKASHEADFSEIWDFTVDPVIQVR